MEWTDDMTGSVGHWGVAWGCGIGVVVTLSESCYLLSLHSCSHYYSGAITLTDSLSTAEYQFTIRAKSDKSANGKRQTEKG